MRTAQYARIERAIAAGEANTTRERWLWGLRILHDPEAIAPSGRSLRHGVAEQLIATAGVNRKGKSRLSEREIQWRLRCAREYPTESQIRSAVSDFDSWHDLVAAGFPAYEAPEGEPPADYRNEREKRRERNRAMADVDSDQEALFPLADFEPAETPLKVLKEYTEEMAELTARFAERDRKRQAYLNRLIDAADGDLSMTWEQARERLAPEDAEASPLAAAS